MDFTWSPEQKELRQSVIEFARRELENDVIKADREEIFDRAGWDKCGAFGIHGLPIPEDHGGGGQDVLGTVCALEALGYACKDNGLIFSINAHMWTCAVPLLLFGTDAQKETYLPKLCSGEWIGGNAISEPDSGSDAFSLRTTATLDGDVYVLNGSKVFCSNGPVADVLVVYATVDREKGAGGVTAFLVEKDAPGFTVSKKTDKMGLRTSPMGELFLDDCRVPADNRLGKEGTGVAAFTHSMDWERGCILASAVGTMERLLEGCIRYAKMRKQFGQPIGKFQLVSSKLVDMRMRLEHSRHMLYRFASLKTASKFALLEAAMAKLCISESWVQTCMDAIQIHGGYGYMTEYELERELRDAMGSRLYSGTSEIQRQIISQFMGF